MSVGRDVGYLSPDLCITCRLCISFSIFSTVLTSHVSFPSSFLSWIYECSNGQTLANFVFLMAPAFLQLFLPIAQVYNEFYKLSKHVGEIAIWVCCIYKECRFYAETFSSIVLKCYPKCSLTIHNLLEMHHSIFLSSYFTGMEMELPYSRHLVLLLGSSRMKLRLGW